MRIYQVLKNQERKKLNRFLKFIHSPYFNINQQITSLAEYLVEAIKTQSAVGDKEAIWVIVTGEQAFDDLKFRKICNDVLERFERFLINEKLDEEKLLQTNLLLQSIKQNKFEALFEKQTKKSNRLINREIDRSAEFYLRVYFNRKIIQSLSTNYEKKSDITNTLTKLTYQDLSLNLDSFYVIEKLRHATDILTWRKLYKTDIQMDLGFSLEMIEKYNLREVPAVRIYLLMYQLMVGSGTSIEYLELKELSQTIIGDFPKEESREVIDVLLSFVIRDVNQGKIEAIREVLELYDWGIKSELILENGFLSPTTFRNYVVGGLRLGEFEKVNKFITAKAQLLKDEHRENAVNFCLCRVAFHKKKFEDVLTYLNKVNYDDIWYNVNSRYYLLASYYELDESDALESAIESFLAFLRREKSIDVKRKAKQVSFAKYLKKLVNNKYNKALVKQLKTTITDDDQVFNKSWLLEKIEELL